MTEDLTPVDNVEKELKNALKSIKCFVSLGNKFACKAFPNVN